MKCKECGTEYDGGMPMCLCAGLAPKDSERTMRNPSWIDYRERVRQNAVPI